MQRNESVWLDSSQYMNEYSVIFHVKYDVSLKKSPLLPVGQLSERILYLESSDKFQYMMILWWIQK